MAAIIAYGKVRKGEDYIPDRGASPDYSMTVCWPLMIDLHVFGHGVESRRLS